MTSINDLFPSKYLKAADADPALTLTIARVTQEKMKNNEGEEETKPVIFFAEETKGMVLNRTNANILTDLFGDIIEHWTGQRVTLCAVEVDAFGKLQKALRFRSDTPKVDRAKLLERHQKLYEEAVKLQVDDLDTYTLSADASEATIIEVGKALRSAVDAAKAF